MPSELEEIWISLLEKYSQGEYREKMLADQKKYFELTGKVLQDEDDYEEKLNCFNDWYIINHITENGIVNVLKDVQNKNVIDENISNAFSSIEYGLYIYKKRNWRKQIVLRDVLRRKNVVLSKEQNELILVENDIFTSRILTYKDNNYLLRGVCLFPQSLTSELKKQAKSTIKVYKKTKEEDLLTTFLYRIESLKTKYLRYGHSDPRKIFENR